MMANRNIGVHTHKNKYGKAFGFFKCFTVLYIMTTQQHYRTMKAMSEMLFGDDKKLEAALKQSIKKAKREKQIRKELNKLTK